jgi:hypothetical protein
MAYKDLHDNIPLITKGHDFMLSSQEESCAWGVLCDGVSNSFDPARAATQAATSISSYLKVQIQNHSEIDYAHIYSEVAVRFNMEAEQIDEAHEQSGKSLFSTTVITALVKDKSAEFSYCGNGAIIEISQEWFLLPEEIPTPWGINNYLNPHSRLIDGENKLYKSIKATDNALTYKPDIVKIEREDHRNYYLICSDGLYSSDEISTGWDEQTMEYYLVENRKLLTFLTLLRQNHNQQWNNISEFTSEFKKLLKGRAVTDDLSYVLFIPEI